MASMQKHSCRLCSSAVAPVVPVAQFFRESQGADIPGRLSRVLDLPMTERDGLSKCICKPCKRKFLAAESFRAMAKSAYDKSLLIARHQRLIPLAQRHNLQAPERGQRAPVVLMSLPPCPRQDLQLSVLPQVLQGEDCVSLPIKTVRQKYG